MKSKSILCLFLLFITTTLSAQVYNNIVTYAGGAAPINGIKIKTNIPYGEAMPTIKIEGYDYGKRKSLHLNIVWYVYMGNFTSTRVSSYGGSTPKVSLSNEKGKVVIFLDSKVYSQRFTVSAFMTGGGADYLKNWTIVDEAISGTNTVDVPYLNSFGQVGIGTDTPSGMLDVRGKITADEIEIKVNKGADFVFSPDYKLKPLPEVEAFISENKHLPEIQSEKDMQNNGLNVNEFQIKLLQKIEELTLYTIQQNKIQQAQEEKLQKQEKIIEQLQEQVIKELQKIIQNGNN